MTAIRLARGATGRNKIVKFEGCYHGHSDSLLVKAGSGPVSYTHLDVYKRQLVWCGCAFHSGRVLG